MNHFFKINRFLYVVSLCAVLTYLSGCGGAYELRYDNQKVMKRASTSTGTFAGNWTVKLKTINDGCDFGLKGKSYNANVAIAQRGNKVTLQIEGFPKAFRGSVSGSTASGTGTYTKDGITLRGSVSVSKTGAKKIKVNRAQLKLQSSKESCQLIFSGSGMKT